MRPNKFLFHAAEDLFFLSPPPSVMVPDIPALNVTRVDGNDVLFYTAVGERGVYRSDPLTSVSVCLSVCLSACLSACLPVCLSVCLGGMCHDP